MAKARKTLISVFTLFLLLAIGFIAACQVQANDQPGSVLTDTNNSSNMTGHRTPP